MKLPTFHPIKPKRLPMLKTSAPKLSHVSMSRVGNGWKMQHHMTHGPQPHPFVFSDPNKMVKHLNRIQASKWREPDRDDTHKITSDLNLGPTV
jgi:hypothetical protein